MNKAYKLNAEIPGIVHLYVGRYDKLLLFLIQSFTYFKNTN